MRDIEKALTSHAYLKELAFSFYLEGNYDESLDTFKKYYLDNDDRRDLLEMIGRIFWIETEKIYGDWIKGSEISTVITAQINLCQLKGTEGQTQSKTRYSEVLVGLVVLCKEKFDFVQSYYTIPILLAEEDYQSLLTMTGTQVQITRNTIINEYLRYGVHLLCKNKLNPA